MLNNDINEPLPLVVVGYDYRKASAKWRSFVVTQPEDDDNLALKLEASGMAKGFAVLNTCNRNEWIATSATPRWTGEILRAQMISILKEKTNATTLPEPFVHIGEDAVRHMLRVSAGLESFVEGERQISGQVNTALGLARKRSRSSVILNGIGPLCGRISRDAMKAEFGDASLRGVHDAAIKYLLNNNLKPDEQEEVAVLGYGFIGRRVVQAIRARTRWQVTILNRSKPVDLNEKIYPLSMLQEVLPKVKALVVCTGAFGYTVNKEALEQMNLTKPVTIIDLGIPVQVEPESDCVENIDLVNLDRLQDSGLTGTIKPETRKMLENQIEDMIVEFTRFCRERGLVKILKTTQSQHERYVHEVIPSLLNEEFPNLSDEERSRLVFRLRGLIREYTNSIFDSIHQATMEKE